MSSISTGPNFLYPDVMEEFGSTQLNRAVSNMVRKLRKPSSRKVCRQPTGELSQ